MSTIVQILLAIGIGIVIGILYIIIWAVMSYHAHSKCLECPFLLSCMQDQRPMCYFLEKDKLSKETNK